MNDAQRAEDLRQAIAEQRTLASGLFDAMYERSRDVEGVTRAGWSDAEEAGIRLIAKKATELGLEVEFDELGQVYATLPGRDRSLPRVAIGSHFDSVRRGGNYDGYAGVVAGMIVLAAFRARGIAPGPDVTVLGMRGEESVWYGIAYIGSRFVVGDLGWEEFSALTRVDTGERITAHLEKLGYDAAAVRKAAGRARLTTANTRAYLELHIEQGPFLEDAGITLAVPTAIRGNARFPEITCHGRYGHAAAAPVDDRRDAVLASVELIGEFDRFWQEQIRAGVPDTQLTVGRVHTDTDREGLTVVPGECRFSVNFGGTTAEFIEAGCKRLHELAHSIAAKRNVRFDLGHRAGSVPMSLDPVVRRELLDAARALSIPCHEMATAGHDAATFGKAGIPAAMVLVRNQNGSHNPHEAMEIDDFLAGTTVLARTVLHMT